MNCLLYARVSTDKQAQKELSIPAQLEMMTQYARKSGWKVVGRYVDRGESARTANRPELKRLINTAEKTREWTSSSFTRSIAVQKPHRLRHN